MRSSAWLDDFEEAVSYGADRALAFVDATTAQATSSIEADVTNSLAGTVRSAAVAGLRDADPVRKVAVLTRIPDRVTRRHPHRPHLEAAHGLTMNMIVKVNAEQRSAIRTVITRAIAKGIDAPTTGKRVSNLVGLFPRWQKAVDHLYTRMLANDIPERIAFQRAADYSDELIKKRGMMIARTELMRAMNHGRLLGWNEAAGDGRFDADESYKYVQEAPFACPDCIHIADPMASGKPLLVKGINTPFKTPWGGVTMPPFHPHCRCTVTLVPVR